MKLFRLESLIPLLVLAAAVMFAYRDPLFVVALRESVFDAYQRLRPRAYQNVPVRIVNIDEESLNRLGQWPWPRSRLAELTQRLEHMGAAAIVFDMLFAEPDRTSPANLLRTWKNAPPPSVWPDEVDDYDAELARAILGGPSVTGFALVPTAQTRLPRRMAGFAYVGGDPRPFLPCYRGAVTTMPLIEDAAAGNGALNVGIAAGGVIRRVPLLSVMDGEIYPSLSAEALRVAQNVSTYVIKMAGSAGETSFGGQTGVTHVRIGAYTVPTDSHGQVWVYYTEPRAERFVSAWEVFEGDEHAEAFRGAVVLIGSTATGLQDLHASPLGIAVPGVTIHARVIEQIMLGVHLTRPDWAKGSEILLMLGLTALVLVLGARIGAMWTAVIGSFAIAAAFAASWYAFRAHRILLDPLYPAATVLVVYTAFSLIRTLHTEREQRWIRKAFASYMSPTLVKQLVENPQHLRLSGERRELTFLFTDLEGFTTLVEQTEPSVVVPVINEYLDGMIRIAFRHNGTVDKVIGDALHVMFGAPIADLDHASHAIACALDIDRFAEAFASAKREDGIAFGRTRIGVNSGSAIVGNFGGDLKFDYTAHGDAINTAARLEGANKYLGTRVCVSENTVRLCPQFLGRPAGHLLLKGKSRAIGVYEAFDGSVYDADALDRYCHAYTLMQQGDAAAEAAFAEIVAERPNDNLAAYHLARLRAGETGVAIALREK